MNKTDMLESIISHYTNGNKAKFAARLGVKPQTISAWIARNTFDAELIFKHCDGISATWLLSGTGYMIEEDNQFADNKQQNAVDGNKLLSLCKLLISNYQQRDDVMNKLVSMVQNAE